MEDGDRMNQHIHACVAYIACRLISGKRIAALYDIAAAKEIEMTCLPNAGLLKEFDDKHKDYIPGFASECSYQFTSSTGPCIEIFINERTFIVHIRGSAAYFIGNIQRDTVYLYDHKEPAHYRYRIIGYVADQEKVARTADDDNGIKD